jgi:hypothetical protein
MGSFADIGYAVDGQMRRVLAAAESKQVAAWREYHSHCGHGTTDEASIVCDITEAYCTYTEEIRAKRQREDWRASEPRVRTDGTRIARDHHFALEMNEALS